jgi:hypothetical protein
MLVNALVHQRFRRLAGGNDNSGELNEIQRQGFQALVSEIHSEQDLAHTLRRFAQFRAALSEQT